MSYVAGGELGMQCILAVLASQGRLPANEPVFWSSADIEQHCRQVLLGVSQHPPLHVFGDHLHRLTIFGQHVGSVSGQPRQGC